MSTTTGSVSCRKKHHLFILFQHGSHGHLGQFFNLQQVVRSRFEDERLTDLTLTLWGTNVNRGKNTDEGTITCGAKLLGELLPAVFEWMGIKTKEHEEYENHFYFSCVGHSFGGLILRETLPQLVESVKQKPLKLVTFLTVASPHCGVRDIKDTYFATPPIPEGKKKPGFISRAWKSTKGAVIQTGGRFLGAVYSQSYQDLFCDNDVLSEKHLFSDSYLNVLKAFHSRHLFGNVHADKKVSFHTSTLHTLSLGTPPSSQEVGPPVVECSNGVSTPHVLPAQIGRGQPYTTNLETLKEYPKVIQQNFEFVVKQREELSLGVPEQQAQLAQRFLSIVGHVHVHPVVHHATPNSKVKAHTFITGQVPGAAAKLQSALQQQTQSLSNENEIESESEDEEAKSEEQQVSSILKTEYEELIRTGKGVTKANLRGSGMVDVSCVVANILLTDFVDSASFKKLA